MLEQGKPTWSGESEPISWESTSDGEGNTGEREHPCHANEQVQAANGRAAPSNNLNYLETFPHYLGVYDDRGFFVCLFLCF